jgi:riboflavin biosynthesis pyrimidine reductase
MNSLSPLELLFDSDRGAALPLPPELSALYGRLGFPVRSDRPYIISNFVSTIDGVVALDAPGKSIGDVISGSNEHDSAVMGLLRSVADVVIVGAGTLRASPRHIWTAEHIYPSLTSAYKSLRNEIADTPTPLNVVVTARADIDPSIPLFQSGKVQVLIVTTNLGAERVKKMGMPVWVQVIAAREAGSLAAREIFAAITVVRPSSKIVLVEGGPHLMGDLFEERWIDELFLTLAPQVAGQARSTERWGIVAERIFAPDNALWGSLVSVKRESSHLFLRYAFDRRGAR